MSLKTQRFILIFVLLISFTMHYIYGIEGERQMGELEYKLERQAAVIKDKQEQIEVLEIMLEHKEDVLKETCLGEFEITYYTAGFESTGKTPEHPAYGITRSGAMVKEGQTIATDWDVLEPGTKVYIEGVGERIVEDTGGLIKGNCIDVYVEDVDVALENGRHMAKVYLVEEEK